MWNFERLIAVLPWLLRGERPLRVEGAPAVGMAVRERGRGKVFGVTRHEAVGEAVVVWGKATGFYETGAAAIEWACDELGRLRCARVPFTRREEGRLIDEIQGRFGFGEERAMNVLQEARVQGC